MKALDIKKMTNLERLQTMEALWDVLLYEEADIKSPEWHQDILRERKEKIKNGKGVFISIDELKAGKK